MQTLQLQLYIIMQQNQKQTNKQQFVALPRNRNVYKHLVSKDAGTLAAPIVITDPWNWRLLPPVYVTIYLVRYHRNESASDNECINTDLLLGETERGFLTDP